MLELHQFEIARHEVQALDVGLADEIAERPARIVVAERAVERLVGLHVELGQRAKEGGKRGLRIEIDREHAVAAQREILGEMRRGRGLARAALEVGEGEDLQLLPLDAAGKIDALVLTLRGGGENAADRVDLRQRVEPPPAGPRHGLRTLAGERKLPQARVGDADPPCGLAGGETAQLLRGGGGKQRLAHGAQLRRELGGMTGDDRRLVGPPAVRWLGLAHGASAEQENSPC